MDVGSFLNRCRKDVNGSYIVCELTNITISNVCNKNVLIL